METAQEFAKVVCGRGQCVCAYDCGHANKSKLAQGLHLLGKETTCPLAKYNVIPDTRSFWERMMAGEAVKLSVNDCWQFCSKYCKHAETSEKGTVHLNDYEEVCVDCPVNMARESISLGDAESRCC